MIDTRFPAKVPEAVVRSTAIEVFAVAVLTVVLRNPWSAAALAVDFAMRAFVSPKLSPFAAISKAVWVPVLHLKGPTIFYTPKKFAAGMGFAMSAAGTVLLFAGPPFAGAAVFSVLALFSFLEGAFGLCVGCKIFGFLAGRGLVDASDCPNCVY